MKNILTGRIDYLNFKDGEMIRSTRDIRATHSIVAKLSLSIYIWNINKCKINYKKIYLYSINARSIIDAYQI
jgi:hypothetical protein